jgi:hypothetical protein
MSVKQPVFSLWGSILCWTLLLVLTKSWLSIEVQAQKGPAQKKLSQSAEVPVLEVKYNLLELPSSRQAHAQLGNTVYATVDRQPLGKALTELARNYQVPMWLDRQVDRSRVVSYDGRGEKSESDGSAMATLRAIARAGGVDVGLVENVLFVGPPDRIAAVQRAAIRLHDEVSRTAKDAKLRSLEWDELATPSELMEKLASQWQVKIDVQLPHDLMHAGRLPSSTLATQLTLLLAGFELQGHCTSAGEILVQPLERQEVWQANYAKKELQVNQLTNARREFPNATANLQSSVATVTGPTNFHLRLFAPVRIPASRGAEDLKFTIPEINAPLRKILSDLSKQLGMQLEWGGDITEAQKDALLKFSVPDPRGLDDVLKVISNSSGVLIERREQVIFVQPQAK